MLAWGRVSSLLWQNTTQRNVCMCMCMCVCARTDHSFPTITYMSVCLAVYINTYMKGSTYYGLPMYGINNNVVFSLVEWGELMVCCLQLSLSVSSWGWFSPDLEMPRLPWRLKEGGNRMWHMPLSSGKTVQRFRSVRVAHRTAHSTQDQLVGYKQTPTLLLWRSRALVLFSDHKRNFDQISK